MRKIVCSESLDFFVVFKYICYKIVRQKLQQLENVNFSKIYSFFTFIYFQEVLITRSYFQRITF